MAAKKEKLQPMHFSEEEWRKRLTPEEYRVLRGKATECAFTGEYFDLKAKGTYVCAACGLPLFKSGEKYDSGSGWPSFWEPIDSSHIHYEEDYHLLYRRIEVQCGRCLSHLGHVFEDGPPPSGKRYCINSVALKFIPESK